MNDARQPRTRCAVGFWYGQLTSANWRTEADPIIIAIIDAYGREDGPSVIGGDNDR